MLKCVEIVAVTSDYLDGQLRFSDGLSVRTHLAICRNCRRFVRQMRLTLRVLQQMPEPEIHDLEAVASQLAEAAKKPS
ncbi:MAG: zf-HC2 domain-containing protein [Pseudomonadaceae bacterium]|jgi:predicted anti-sigma-YlaC factor YlaD|nr:zf-HC2 domain-containing protein [Pseudomonadaceae bacterium]